MAIVQARPARVLCLFRLRRTIRNVLAACVLHVAAGAQVPGQAAVDAALRNTQASAVVLDVTTGNTLARYGGSANALPGSTLKPFLLAAALQKGIVTATITVSCRGGLKLDGRNLACTHPREMTVFAAQDALAYSCNTWFAQLADHMTPIVLSDALRSYGFRVGGRADSRSERVLLTLGLAGVHTSAEELAAAYRRLAVQMSEAPQTSGLRVVEAGLVGSVRYGMAHEAAVDGVSLAGKTGTASEAGQAWTHGWFAGIVYASAKGKPMAVLVVFVPRGSGADAAGLARRILEVEKDRAE